MLHVELAAEQAVEHIVIGSEPWAVERGMHILAEYSYELFSNIEISGGVAEIPVAQLVVCRNFPVVAAP